MAFTDDLNALNSEIPSTVSGYTTAASAQLNLLQADLASLTALQTTIAAAIETINAQIAAYQSIVPAMPTSLAPAATVTTAAAGA